MKTTLYLTLLLATPTFGQTIYKCPLADGTMSYQQAPCQQGAILTPIDNGKITGTALENEMAGLRPGERAALAHHQQQAEQRQAEAAEARREALRSSQQSQTNAYDLLIEQNRSSDAILGSLYRAYRR